VCHKSVFAGAVQVEVAELFDSAQRRPLGVRFVNVPSFAWMLDASVDTPSFGTVTGDIAYGGAFYFYVDGAAHDLDIHDVRIETLKNFGMEVLDAANARPR
jgi:trans-L-3-hydroxyproline dehydratase